MRWAELGNRSIMEDCAACQEAENIAQAPVLCYDERDKWPELSGPEA